MTQEQLEYEFRLKDWLKIDIQTKRESPVAFYRPQQFACWTKSGVNHSNKIDYGSTEGLAHYRQPNITATSGIDLKQGFKDNYIPKDDNESAPVEAVVGAIQYAAQSQGGDVSALGQILEGVHVVSYRNNLNKIFGCISSTKTDWIVDACLVDDTMFLEIVKTDNPGSKHANNDMMTYWGYKFERVCNSKAKAEEVLDPTAEYGILVRLVINDFVIMMAAEIDATDPKLHPEEAAPEGDMPPLNTYVELKLHKPPQGGGQRHTMYAMKYPRWWIQSFLAGVETIALGHRDDDGILRKVERLRVQTMPGEARTNGARWDAWQMLRCGTSILQWMHRCAQSAPGSHVRFEYTSQDQTVRCTQLGEHEASLGQRICGIYGYEYPYQGQQQAVDGEGYPEQGEQYVDAAAEGYTGHEENVHHEDNVGEGYEDAAAGGEYYQDQG